MKCRFSFLFLAILILANCVVDPPADIDSTVSVTGITITLSAQILPPGTQYQLGATITPANATDTAITWTSSAPGVASVNAGLVQALTDGAATIIVTTHDGGFTATCAITVETQVIPPPAGLTGPVLAALYDGVTVRLWDGTNTVDWKTGVARHGNGSKITVGQVLYFLDSMGSIVQAINLPALPAGVTVIGDPVTWTFEEITREQAYEIDYTPGARTRIWRDGAEYGDWHANAWNYVESFEAGNGDLIAMDDLGRFHDITRPAIEAEMAFTHTVWIIPGGPIVHMPDFDHSNEVTIYSSEYPEGLAVTITGGAIPHWGYQPWMKSGTTWIDGYGDVLTATSLSTRANGLSAFTTVPSTAWQQSHGYQWPNWSDIPVMIPAYTEAGMLYFIETSTGMMWSWSPGTDVVAKTNQLYAGTGKNEMGYAKLVTLEPELIDGAMYFHDGGTLWKRDNASTIISSFSADQKLWVMQ